MTRQEVSTGISLSWSPSFFIFFFKQSFSLLHFKQIRNCCDCTTLHFTSLHFFFLNRKVGKLDCFQIHWLRFSKLWKWFSKLAPDKPYQYGESRSSLLTFCSSESRRTSGNLFFCEVFGGWFWWSARHLHLNFCWPTVNMVIQVFGKTLRGRSEML